MLKLDPQVPPIVLTVSAGNVLTVRNVLIGEVWHASGQSNMHFPLSSAASAADDLPKADYPGIRYFQVDPWHADSGSWVVCSPKSAGNFSAVAYYFAAALHEHLKRPVGILDSSVSGAVVQTFLSPEAAAGPQLAETIAHVTSDQQTSGNFNTCIGPKLVPYAIRGVIWYQGEGNRTFPVSYQKMFSALIADWRNLWGQGDFPFLFVQLANYGQRQTDPTEVKDAALREAQLKTLAVPNTAMAVTIDCTAHQIGRSFHEQEFVGGAFAKPPALAYGEKIEYSGPIFQSAKFEGGKAIVSFTHIGGGLAAKGDKLVGFTLSGGANKWVRADAAIEGDHVIVHSDAIAKPVVAATPSRGTLSATYITRRSCRLRHFGAMRL